MALLKHGRLVEDPWQRVDPDLDDKQSGFPLYSLEQWQEAGERLGQTNEPVGLWLRSGQSPREIAADIPRFAVIALEFPKFTDGRPYSTARVLRQRHGYAGELRAVGQVLRDQLAFMARCGFDAFAIADEADSDDWLKAFENYSHWYQASSDGQTPVARLRSRKKAAAC